MLLKNVFTDHVCQAMTVKAEAFIEKEENISFEQNSRF
jgi:hypothetical protein